jgi:hypothetical protein
MIPTMLLTPEGKKVIVDRAKDPCLYRRTDLVKKLNQNGDECPRVYEAHGDIYIHEARSGNVYFYYYCGGVDELVNSSTLGTYTLKQLEELPEQYTLIEKPQVESIVLGIVVGRDRNYLDGLNYELAQHYLDESLFQEDA